MSDEVTREELDRMARHVGIAGHRLRALLDERDRLREGAEGPYRVACDEHNEHKPIFTDGRPLLDDRCPWCVIKGLRARNEKLEAVRERNEKLEAVLRRTFALLEEKTEP